MLPPPSSLDACAAPAMLQLLTNSSTGEAAGPDWRSAIPPEPGLPVVTLQAATKTA